jgi:hydrogenase-4 component F
MPVVGSILMMALLAILGMPPFSLFQSEFVILKAAFEAGNNTVTALFILFGIGIFAGALMHVGGLVLGQEGETPRIALRPWRDGPLLALAAVLVVIAFWLPAPLLELIRGAARVVSGE